MDTQLLAAFVEVADTGSFTAAAQALHLSQPAVSKRIQALEAQIATPLFDRVGRQVLLTDAGRALLPYARKVLQDIEDGRRALSQLAGEVRGRLSIGTSHHIGLHRLPPVLSTFAQRYPQVDLDLHFMDSEVACEAVLGGKLELGIVTLPLVPIPNLDARPVWPDPLAVVVSPHHPLARLRRLALAQLAEHPAVLPDEATYTHRIVRQALRQHGLEPRVRLATNYLETLKMLVGIGLGWSVLPLSMADRTLRVLAIPGLKMERMLGVVRHRQRTPSRAALALLDLLPAAAQHRSA
ncbi:transcriptional regulator, LysR family [Fontimonas thermophila]|uniref:Transcriptional regulator, LysR family n=1 Tax=Fontimonas thermophila TaxID=1076937 RepID=A0A1I2HLK1_9GAMM|nr:LysR family transcriptional regulator [Fontimonas thermophila]SFF31205.1 transcriptional regulator, LysR family [Fontimonas thermophila]